jgi:uncharacterized protein (UPF0218 family)
VPKKKALVKNQHLPKKDKKVIRLLTDVLRKELKKPQGLLIEGSFKETVKRLKELIEKEQPSLIISVGDMVSRNMIQGSIPPDVLIVDNKVMRKPVQPIEIDTKHILYANNPPGTITDEAWNAIRRAIEKKGQIEVVIDGEEDLLTIVAVLSLPENAIVVYGQPHVGIVVVKVTEETREKMRRFIDAMEESSKS